MYCSMVLLGYKFAYGNILLVIINLQVKILIVQMNTSWMFQGAFAGTAQQYSGLN